LVFDWQPCIGSQQHGSHGSLATHNEHRPHLCPEVHCTQSGGGCCLWSRHLELESFITLVKGNKNLLLPFNAGTWNWNVVYSLDRIVDYAGAHGIKLILALLDNWDTATDSKDAVGLGSGTAFSNRSHRFNATLWRLSEACVSVGVFVTIGTLRSCRGQQCIGS
jgi:hypothetical protein